MNLPKFYMTNPNDVSYSSSLVLWRGIHPLKENQNAPYSLVVVLFVPVSVTHRHSPCATNRAHSRELCSRLVCFAGASSCSTTVAPNGATTTSLLLLFFVGQSVVLLLRLLRLLLWTGGESCRRSSSRSTFYVVSPVSAVVLILLVFCFYYKHT